MVRVIRSKTDVCPYCGSKITRPQFEAVKKKIAEQQEKLVKKTLKDEKIKIREEVSSEWKEKLDNQTEEFENQRAQWEQKVKREGRKKDEWYLKEIEKWKRKAERQTSQDRGELGEEPLFNKLLSDFPDDHIERIRAGRDVKRADIRQTVFCKGKTCGVIIYECKNVQDWKNDYLEQAKKYREQYSTPYIILATTAFPAKCRGLAVVDDIILTDFERATIVAKLIRQSVIDLHKANLSHKEKELRVELLFEYIQSPDFNERLLSIQESIRKLNKILQDERGRHAADWDKRVSEYNNLQEKSIEIQTRLKKIMEESPPLVVIKRRVKRE